MQTDIDILPVFRRLLVHCTVHQNVVECSRQFFRFWIAKNIIQAQERNISAINMYMLPFYLMVITSLPKLGLCLKTIKT